jgi:hypothetical protein
MMRFLDIAEAAATPRGRRFKFMRRCIPRCEGAVFLIWRLSELGLYLKMQCIERQSPMITRNGKVVQLTHVIELSQSLL